MVEREGISRVFEERFKVFQRVPDGFWNGPKEVREVLGAFQIDNGDLRLEGHSNGTMGVYGAFWGISGALQGVFSVASGTF